MNRPFPECVGGHTSAERCDTPRAEENTTVTDQQQVSDTVRKEQPDAGGIEPSR
jgi:hypothetical protein